MRPTISAEPGRSYNLGRDDRLLVKLLPSTVPQREIRIVTGRREH